MLRCRVVIGRTFRMIIQASPGTRLFVWEFICGTVSQALGLPRTDSVLADLSQSGTPPQTSPQSRVCIVCRLDSMQEISTGISHTHQPPDLAH